MAKSSSIIRIKTRTVKELRTKKLLNDVAERLQGKELFPQKIEKAKAFFKGLQVSW
ncbi:hypothetical protein [Chitinophaga qingshengii]|uniref:Uncharacterized protein n=1 Tax=Chitinophaga qingshengii TaxID=1569794 RepID=A0ABR7TM52_9BACT|nr:hypothetical protein [Chitinophaga qingshengii]MBC9931568.1 hypothetical protein [Chitinophaga qingshengii]